MSAKSQNNTTSQSHDKPLDDVMLAMDVVDTLRRNKRLVEKELSNDDQDQSLLKRLNEIYSAQGIDVPDYILREGVQALREDRFTYVPTPPSFSRKIAEIYVSRAKWGRKVVIGFSLLIFLIVGYYTVVIYPKEREKRQIEEQLSTSLPASLKTLYQGINETTEDQTIKIHAEEIFQNGIDAINQKNIVEAKLAEENLQNLLDTLKNSYRLRIVSGLNERSGVWRVPDDNWSARNYYIIVEPISINGTVLSVNIMNEENNVRVKTNKFGVRVSQDIYNRVANDKQDDGIIQNNIIGEKRRGDLKTKFSIPVLNGTITEW